MYRSVRPNENVPAWALRSATALAVLVSGGYLAIGLGFVSENFESPPAPIMMVAGLAYLVGGLLIFLADQRLLLAGAIINAVVLLIFAASALRGSATIDLFSISMKVAQIALGVLLVWFAAQGNRMGPEALHHR